MKHTPGPWLYLPEFNAVVVFQGHKVKAVADFGKTDLPEKEANAKLMSASKELLEALVEYVERQEAECVANDSTPDGLPEYEKAMLAIKKAKD